MGSCIAKEESPFTIIVNILEDLYQATWASSATYQVRVMGCCVYHWRLDSIVGTICQMDTLQVIIEDSVSGNLVANS